MEDSRETMPGVGSDRAAVARQVLATLTGALWLPSGAVIRGASSRDPLNTGDVNVLRAGLLMGRRSADLKYAPSILGKLTVAGTAAGANITVSAATATEIVRRFGAVGTATGAIQVVGPPTIGGTVVAKPVSWSAIDLTTGVITLAINAAVAEVQTITIATASASGTYRIYYAGEWTTALAWNANVAAINAALDALPNTTASDIVIANVGGDALISTNTFTFANTLGNVAMLQVDTSLLKTAAGAECVISMAETTPGELAGAATLTADMVNGSLVMPLDGSQNPLTVITDQYGMKVTDVDNANIDIRFAKMLVAGILKSGQILNYPTDPSIIAWLKAQLRLKTVGLVFDDDY